MSTAYRLVYEDLTHLGMPMGMEYTTNTVLGYYATAELAKEAAQKNWDSNEKKRKRETSKLKWKREKKNYRTDDLRYVMYWIVPIKIEGAEE